MNQFNDQNFKEEVLSADKPVLVDFWKPGCAPCKTMKPIIEKIAEETEGEAKVGKLNTMKNPKMAKKFEIRAVPTLIIFNDGEAVERASGARQKDVILEKIREYV
ncbi:MAG: thioredoxin [Candidatus Paceibacterota bacterium]